MELLVFTFVSVKSILSFKSHIRFVVIKGTLNLDLEGNKRKNVDCFHE